MRKIHQLRELINAVDQSSVQEFTYETEAEKITIKKKGERKEAVAVVHPASAPVAQPSPEVHQATMVETPTISDQPSTELEADAVSFITSPMVGTFYAAPEPGAEPYVKVGDKVNQDTVVCIVEAMKLFNEIEADVSGEIIEVNAKDGQLVEYGQPLFTVRKN